jgi:hypothetical protein
MSLGRVFASVTCFAIAVLVFSGCSSNSVPPKWEAAYQALNLDTLNTRDQHIVDCLADHGFPGFTVNWNGGFESPPLPVEQRDVVKKTMALCMGKSGDGAVAPPNGNELTARYHLEIAAAKCLEDHGYPAESAPPSLQRFKELSGTDQFWSAYGAVADQLQSDSDLRKIGAVCPDPGWFAGLIPAEGH